MPLRNNYQTNESPAFTASEYSDSESWQSQGTHSHPLITLFIKDLSEVISWSASSYSQHLHAYRCFIYLESSCSTWHCPSAFWECPWFPPLFSRMASCCVCWSENHKATSQVVAYWWHLLTASPGRGLNDFQKTPWKVFQSTHLLKSKGRCNKEWVIHMGRHWV